LISLKEKCIYGFAIFAMFFGSGNLVFPIQIGQSTGVDWGMGLLGLTLTGILLPCLGLFVIKLHDGRYERFFNEAGTVAGFLLPLFTLSLLGAFGVVPRCITVAYGGLGVVFPQISLTAFSLVFSIACFFVCLRDHLVIQVLGKWMTPVLLAGLAMVIVFGFAHAEAAPIYALTPVQAFSGGFLTGYQTMDLFAAFFFSALIFQHIQTRMGSQVTPRQVLVTSIQASSIGAVLLMIVYGGFVFLGAHYAGELIGVEPQLLLPTIANHVLGSTAHVVISIVVVFSCFTTAVALNNIYARYLSVLFKSEKYFVALLFAVTSISFGISLLDFHGIAGFLAPMLELSYPSLIVLTVLSLIKRGKTKLKMLAFYASFALSAYVQYGA